MVRTLRPMAARYPTVATVSGRCRLRCAPRPSSEPRTATPRAPPAWRAALSGPLATPARSGPAAGGDAGRAGAVRGRARGQHDGGQREGVGVDDPLQPGGRAAEADADQGGGRVLALELGFGGWL